MPDARRALVAALLGRLRPKAKSLIVTVYGDAIAHHGGTAWLGSVIALVAPLGINERMVRTSVFRLSKEDWLTAQPIGRRSYYRLTDTGRRWTDAVHERIYRHAPRPWDGGWTMVALGTAGLDAETRDDLRRDLGWLGFGLLAPGVMIHPDPDETALRETLTEAGRPIPVMRGPAAAWVAPEALSGAVRACWDLDRLSADYTAFLDAFRPVWQTLRNVETLDPELCFAVRALLSHGYRRAILRDPMLPDQLLPADWPGTAAHALCRNLYRLIEAAAERHVMAVLETPEGPAPAAHPSYFTRFGGL